MKSSSEFIILSTVLSCFCNWFTATFPAVSFSVELFVEVFTAGLGFGTFLTSNVQLLRNPGNWEAHLACSKFGVMNA